MSTEGKGASKVSLFNSFLLAVCLAVMGWVAHKSADNAEVLAALRASVDAAKEASAKAERFNAESLARVERKLDEMVPRREFEARFLQIETELHKNDIHLRDLDLEILKLKQRIP